MKLCSSHCGCWGWTRARERPQDHFYLGLLWLVDICSSVVSCWLVTDRQRRLPFSPFEYWDDISEAEKASSRTRQDCFNSIFSSLETYWQTEYYIHYHWYITDGLFIQINSRTLLNILFSLGYANFLLEWRLCTVLNEDIFMAEGHSVTYFIPSRNTCIATV